MKYFGSKSRIAKHIVPILQKEIDENHITTYFEPFVGGANIIDKIICPRRVANDLNRYLIELYEHIIKGGELPESVSKELYDRARIAWHKNEEDMNVSKSYDLDWWEIGAIGFLASYNGRWFDGGYAKSGYEKTKYGLRYRDYYRESKDNLLKQIPLLNDVEFYYLSYGYFTPEIEDSIVGKGTLIYCDPPYANTKQFHNATKFDYEEFWNTMREWSKSGAIVYISELEAPDDFECVWEQEVSRSVNAKNKTRATEKLFKWKGE